MKSTFGYLLIVVASVIWGTLGVFGKLAFGYGIDPQTLIALRLLISSVTLLLPITLVKRELLKIRKKDIGWFLGLGFFAVALQRITYFYAIDLTTATIAAMLYYTYPVIVTIYASLFLKERITLQTVLAVALTFSGVALVVKAYETSWFNANLAGIVLGILSSVFFAMFFLLTKKLRGQYTNWTLVLYGDGIGALVLLPVTLNSLPDIVGYPQQLWVLLLTIAWFSSLLAYLLYSYALKHVESSKGSILSVIEPLSAAFFSLTILGEQFEPLQALGVALTLIGIVLLFYRPKFKRQKAQLHTEIEGEAEP
ncbi:MAG TPA: EamA family transporter [Candidatus Acidoferrum sp.]|jgi:drug/metabolite transporter (DMT)-like permease|nr:EamA family transporter [Candidatus Acidoferrum sp.]